MRKRLLLLLAVAVAASAALVDASVSSAIPATTTVYAWIGLKNSDDVGTRFDVKAEVTNGSSEGYGYAYNVSGGSSGFNNAHLVAIPVSNYVGSVGQSVSVTISVRVACASGHASGTARLWWNDSAANSRVVDSGFGTLYLTDTNTLSPSVGPGPKKTSDVFVKKSGCPNQTDNWHSFGTWTNNQSQLDCEAFGGTFGTSPDLLGGFTTVLWVCNGWTTTGSADWSDKVLTLINDCLADGGEHLARTIVFPGSDNATCGKGFSED